MYQLINEYDFVEAFKKMDRENNFSMEGRKALFNYLEELEENKGIELDVIAICCDYTEYKNIKEFQNAYSEDYKTIEDIEEKTQVIKIDDESFIIQNF